MNHMVTFKLTGFQFVMWMQQGRIWHLGKIKFYVYLETSGKNTQLKIWFRSEIIFFLLKIKISRLKTTNKRNLNTKWHLPQSNQNAETTLLDSHDELFCLTKWLPLILFKPKSLLLILWHCTMHWPCLPHEALISHKLWLKNITTYRDEKCTQAPTENDNLLLLTFILANRCLVLTSVYTQADARHAELTVWSAEGLSKVCSTY